MALWPNGKESPGTVWSEYGPRKPIQTPNGPTSNFHAGIDIAPWDKDSWLLAPDDGEIVYAGYDDIFGNRVIVESGNVQYKLCHGVHGTFLVNVGSKVEQTQPLLMMGETGKANGRHVHFEVWVNGSHVNPRDFYAHNTGKTVQGKDEEMIVNIQGRANVRRGGAFYIEGGKATFLGGTVAGAPSLTFDQGTALAARVNGIN